MSKYLLNVVRKLDDIDSYPEVVATSSLGTPFHNPSWLQAMSLSVPKYQLGGIEYRKAGELVGILPVFKRAHGRVLVSLAWGGYGGYVGELPEKSLPLPHGVLYRIANYHNLSYRSVYRTKTDASTWVLDTTRSYDEIFSSFHQKTRNQIRKAAKCGVSYKEVTTASEVAVCYKIYGELLKKHGVATGLNQETFVALLGKPSIDFIAAYYHNKIIAFSVFLASRNEIFYWVNASDRTYSKLNATNGILNLVLEKAALSSTVKKVNLGAVPRGNTGLKHFKERWGTIEQRYNIETGIAL